MIIAIDGPAGSGKSTVAQKVAERLGFTYLDTGAMYRTVTLLAFEQGVSLEDDDALGGIALEMDLHFEEDNGGLPRVFVGEREVTQDIRSPLVTQKVSLVSAHEKVRHALTLRQRRLAAEGNMVLEGRDIGTVVCPTAAVKVYLNASVEERARRRQEQLEQQGICISLKTLERDLLLRDSYDSGRSLAPLRKAKDAVEMDTTNMSIEDVVNAVVAEVDRARERGTEGGC
ncbi:MAG: (d)CMP kinase [Thermoleophilia bacterium]